MLKKYYYKATSDRSVHIINAQVHFFSKRSKITPVHLLLKGMHTHGETDRHETPHTYLHKCLNTRHNLIHLINIIIEKISKKGMAKW